MASPVLLISLSFFLYGSSTLLGVPEFILAQITSPLSLHTAEVTPINLGGRPRFPTRWLIGQPSRRLWIYLSPSGNCPPTNVHRVNALLSSAIALAAKKAIPKGSRKTQCAWWCPEVEQSLIRCCQAQADLQSYSDDDDKAESFQLASCEAQETIEDAKARLWQEFITDSRGELSSAEIWSVIRARMTSLGIRPPNPHHRPCRMMASWPPPTPQTPTCSAKNMLQSAGSQRTRQLIKPLPWKLVEPSPHRVAAPPRRNNSIQSMLTFFIW